MLKHEHSRASAGDICVGRIDQFAHLAAVHLNFEVARILLDGKLADQDKICAPFENSLRCLRVIAAPLTSTLGPTCQRGMHRRGKERRKAV